MDKLPFDDGERCIYGNKYCDNCGDCEQDIDELNKED